MKSLLPLLTVCSLCLFTSCLEELEAEDPRMEQLTIYTLTDNGNGQLIRDQPTTQASVGEPVQIDVITTANLATLWTGDFSYRPWGQTDSLLNSRAYVHYGQLGAEGIPMSQLEGAVGYTLRYTWSSAGTFDLAVVLTNHGIDSPEYKQAVFQEQQITVTP